MNRVHGTQIRRSERSNGAAPSFEWDVLFSLSMPGQPMQADDHPPIKSEELLREEICKRDAELESGEVEATDEETHRSWLRSLRNRR